MFEPAPDSSQRSELETLLETQRLLTEGIHNVLVTLHSFPDLEEVFEVVMQNLGRLIPQDTANLMLLDEQGMIRIAASYGFEKYHSQAWTRQFHFPLIDFPNLHHIYMTGSHFLIPDTSLYSGWRIFPEIAWINSILSIPIKIDGEIIGFINLDSHKKNAFTDLHVRWLQIFAEQVALAIKNARLFAEERAQRLFTEALMQATAAVNGMTDENAVLQTIVEKASDVIPAAEMYGILFFEGETFRLVHYNLNAPNEEAMAQAQQPHFPIAMLPKGMLSSIYQRQSVFVSSPQELEDWEYIENWDWVQSFACAPIVIDETVIGLMFFASRHPYTYKAIHARWLMAFADQAATALKKNRLYTDLAQERAQLSSILDAAHEGICYIEGTLIVYANQSFAALLGYPIEGIKGRDYAFFWESYNKQELKTAAEQAIQRGETWRGNLRVRRQDGMFVNTAYSLSPVGQPAEKRMVALVRDISQEQQLRSRQTRFITNAAHELRHPLTRLSNRLYLLRRQPEQIDEHLTVLQGVSNDMTRLIGDMAEFIRLEQGDLSLHPLQFQLMEAFGRVRDRYAENLKMQQLTLTIHVTAAPAPVQGDLILTAHLLDKLLIYIMSQTPVNGMIRVDLTQEAAMQIFTLTYSGVPVPPRQLDRVFDPFFQASEGEHRHSGLELSIAKFIAQLHRWELTAEPGCVFRLKIPL